MFRLIQLSLILICLNISQVFSADSLSYSGRLVNANGAPVTGPVNLKFDLAYTNDLSIIRCSQRSSGVDLVNGVFHIKLTFNCPSSSLGEVLAAVPLNNSIAIRVTDETPTTPKVYSYQALHSVPFSVMSDVSKQLVQMNATNGQVLTWLNGLWVPQDPAGAAAIADGSVTGAKLNQMGATVGQVLKWTNGGWAPEADIDTGITTETDPNVRAFARTDASVIPTCDPDQKLDYVLMAESFVCADVIISAADMRSATVADEINDAETLMAPSQNAVFDALADKQPTIDSSSDITMKYLKLMTDGAFWVGLKAPISTTGNILFTLPSTQGTSGQVLKTDGAGNLSWFTPTTDSSSISDGSIVDADISSTADIDQSKILNLTTDLAGKENTIAAGVAGQYWAPNKTWQTLNTDVVAEGTNKYFTDSLARAAISGTTPLSYNSTTGVMSLSTVPTSLGGTGLTSPGTSGNLLQSNGTSWVSWTPNYLTAVPNLDASKITTGVLPVARGGTNTGALTGNRIMISSSTAIGESAALNNGQLLIGSTGAAPVAANLTAGSGVTITNSSGGISISATGSGGTVTSVSGTAPVSVATGTTTPVISMAAASGTTDGYLTSANWTTFNNKQAALSSGATINGIVYPANGTQTLQIPLAPVNASDAVNKQYVDSFGQWQINGGNIYRASGNVGIGTSTPATSFNIVGTGGGNDDVMIDSITESGEGTLMLRRARGIPGAPTKLNANDRIGFMTFRGYNGTTYADLARVQGTAATDLDLSASGILQFFTTNAGSNTEKMRITPEGNIGVGTAAPNAKLEVAGGSDPVAIRLTETTGAHAQWELRSYNVALTGGDNQFSIWGGIAGSTQSDRLVISPSGNVGINNPTPSAALDVSSATGEMLILRDTNNLESEGAHTAFLRAKDSAGTNTWYLGDGSSTVGGTWLLNYQANPIHLATAGTTRLTVDGTGNVGIGTQAPTTKLEVNGTVKATNFQGTLNGIKMGAGEFVFANGACGGSVATPCSISIAAVGFTGVPACTITMRNRDATAYTEKMVIKDITASAITIWRGNYPDAGTTMQGYWTCMGN